MIWNSAHENKVHNWNSCTSSGRKYNSVSRWKEKLILQNFTASVTHLSTSLSFMYYIVIVYYNFYGHRPLPCILLSAKLSWWIELYTSTFLGL